MIKLYNSLIEGGLKFKIKSGADILKTSEEIFHSMFGKYLDNLDILSQITFHMKWHQRRELNSVFSKRAMQQ